MVFEKLGSNLLDLTKLHNYKGIPLPLVKCMTKQVRRGRGAREGERARGREGERARGREGEGEGARGRWRDGDDRRR
jgi:hypothetical protein